MIYVFVICVTCFIHIHGRIHNFVCVFVSVVVIVVAVVVVVVAAAAAVVVVVCNVM